MKACFILTLVFGKKIYMTVTMKKTVRKGTTYCMSATVIIPIFRSGNICLNVFRSGIKDVVMKEIKSIIMINVMTSTDRTSDQKKVLFFFTLKMMLIAFSKEAKT